MLLRWSVKGSALTGAEDDENKDSIARSPIPILTIASGIITIPSVSPNKPAPGVYYVLPESGTADDLIQINGALGMEEMITLRTNTVGHVITLLHTPGNLRISPSTFVLDSIYDSISFRSRAVNVWAEDHRQSVPAT